MAGLAARCTACGTVFRVVPDQLRVAGGYVRCGRCSAVFNAAESLIDLDSGVPTSLAPVPAHVPAHVPAPVAEPTPESVEAVEAVTDPGVESTELATPDLSALDFSAGAPAALVEPEPEPELAPAEAGTDFELQFEAAPSAPKVPPEAETAATAAAYLPADVAAAEAFELDLPQPELAAEPEPAPEPEIEAEPAPLRIDYDPVAASEPLSIELTLPPPTPDAPPQRLALETALADSPAPAESADAEEAAAAAAATALSAEPADKPSFVRSAERAERWNSPRLRLGMAAAGVLGLLLLAAQVAHSYRDLIVARWPATRAVMAPACAALGCRIEAPRSIESLSIESSGLVRVEKSSVYKLQVALRNRSAAEVALPALDLTLSDSQGKPLARRVLRANELGVNTATLAAGREVALQATLQAQFASGEAVAGYTVDPFYP